MNRILVPTDFSPTAEKAFRFAVDMASKQMGQIILYHVYTPVESTYLDLKKNKLYNEQEESNIIKRLQRLKKKVLAELEAVPVSTIVGHPPLIDNVLGFAEHNQADMIVMGTQGASGLRKSILGSIAAKITTLADIPVLLIPERFEWRQPELIIFATDFQPSDHKVLARVIEISKLYNAGVVVLHMQNAYDDLLDKAKQKDDFDAYAFRLQKEFSETNLKFHLLQTTAVFETMEHLESEFPHHLLVMVRRNKSFYEKYFLGSFTKNLASVIETPLLIVPEEN